MILQIVLLLGGSCILREMPLDVAVLIFEGATSDFEWSHRHSWADLGQFDTVISCPHENVVSDFNAILDVLESNDSVANFVLARDGFSRRKDVLQDLDYALT
ncbi:hypothetical protein HG531_008139 [Fusarium graminearum]|nr:hypothetical protein HG531_008139 [Fusarium graminearum]